MRSLSKILLRRSLPVSVLFATVHYCPECLADASSAQLNLPSLTSPESMCSKGGTDGKAVVKSMLEKVRQMKAYSFDSKLVTYSGDKPIVETGKFYFKSPDMLRFEVISAGVKSGSVVVRQPDGKIRGQMGGLLHGMKMKLSPDSKLLKTANGFNILQSDLETLLADLASRTASDLNCLATTSGAKAEVVETLLSDGGLSDRILVDAPSDLPEQWGIFKGKKIYSVVSFDNLKARNDLPDSFFNLAADDAEKGLEPHWNELLGLQGARGAQSLSARAYDEVRDAHNVMRQRLAVLQALLSRQSSSAGAANPSPGGSWPLGLRETVLSTSVDIESVVALLNPVGNCLGFGAKSEAMGNQLSASWARHLDVCRKSSSDLIDSLEFANPRIDLMNKSCQDLGKAIDGLQDDCKKALELNESEGRQLQ